MLPLRKLAGALLLASAATHLSEPFVFPFSLPLVVATLYGLAFLFIGICLFRAGTRVLWWGAILPLSAAFLGTAHAVLQGTMHPITRWHLFVDLVVGPICIYLLRHRAVGAPRPGADALRVAPEEYERIELRAHALLAGVPLHDVWALDLSGGPGRTLVDLRALLAAESPTRASTLVRLLFALRARLGRVLGWDREPPQVSEASFLHRLSAADRASSLVAPGTLEGPFRVLFVSPREAISEIQNSTVHAFSVFALVERPGGHRLHWAIYVQPVGRITAWYMRLIDPFRRIIIYPAVLRRLAAAWSRREARGGAAAAAPAE